MMPSGTEVCLGPDDIVLDGDPAPPPQNGSGALAPIFGPFLLWPNCWMHQDATWYAGRPQPRRLCVRWGPTPPLSKKGQSPTPIFGPFLLWPNGWMDKDGTWYAGRPQPRRLCVRWGPSFHSSKRGRSPPPQFSAHFYCGQTAGCIKMPLGIEVGLSRCDLMLDGEPVPPEKGQSPQFSAHVYCGQTAGWIKMALGMEVGLGPGHIMLHGDPAPLPKKVTEPPIFGPSLLWPNGWMDQDVAWYGGRPRPIRHCVTWGPSAPPKRAQPPIFGPCLL